MYIVDLIILDNKKGFDSYVGGCNPGFGWTKLYMVYLTIIISYYPWSIKVGGLSLTHIPLTKREVKILLNSKESRTTEETKRTTELYLGPQVELTTEINQGEASYDQ